MAALPAELVSELFGHLGVRELLACSRVCTTWRAITRTSTHGELLLLWEAFHVVYTEHRQELKASYAELLRRKAALPNFGWPTPTAWYDSNYCSTLSAIERTPSAAVFAAHPAVNEMCALLGVIQKDRRDYLAGRFRDIESMEGMQREFDAKERAGALVAALEVLASA